MGDQFISDGWDSVFSILVTMQRILTCFQKINLNFFVFLINYNESQLFL